MKNLICVIIVLILLAGCEMKMPTDADMIRAANNGDVEEMKKLIGSSGNINAEIRGASPISIACENGDEAMAALLIKNGINPNTRLRASGDTMLHVAARNGHIKVMELLLKKGADVDAINLMSATPLQLAIGANQKETVKFLTENAADIRTVDRAGKTPLIWAAERGHVDFVKILIDRSVKLNVVDKNGMTALDWAIELKFNKVENLLRARGAKAVRHADGEAGK
ncbi:MAG: ankyrin repeat domain-containing protein [Planctomycetota bacterium]|jgi:ankyrin repeat protein